MKVLVIDDSEHHLEAAQQTLAEHDLTVCNSYDQARELLSHECGEEKRKKRKAEYLAQGESDDMARYLSGIPSWDVVLCDLLMPAGTHVEGKGRSYIGQEMPVGWALALLAAKHGAKYVAVVTDTNHHDHPASAMLDDLDFHLFQIGEAKVLFTNHVDRVGEKCGKNWGEILRRLTTGDPYKSWQEINV